MRPMPWIKWLGLFAASLVVLEEGEGAWLLPEGEKPYWRGRITSSSHEFATQPVP